MTVKLWSLGALTLFAATAAGCSDPVPAAARGAMAFTITSCQQYTGGVSKNGNVPTNNFPGERLVDGEGGSNISCTVQGGPPFGIRGTIKGHNNHPGATFDNEPLELTINSGQITETGTGTADMTLFAGQVYKSSTTMPCTLTVAASGAYEVASGRIYGAFNCVSNLDVQNAPVDGCSANGVFVFERCEE